MLPSVVVTMVVELRSLTSSTRTTGSLAHSQLRSLPNSEAGIGCWHGCCTVGLCVPGPWRLSVNTQPIVDCQLGNERGRQCDQDRRRSMNAGLVREYSPDPQSGPVSRARSGHGSRRSIF